MLRKLQQGVGMTSDKWVDRVMIFIDGSNLFHSFKEFRPGAKYSVKKLIDKLVKGRRLIRAYYFGSEKIPPSQGQTKFYDAIRYEGIDVTTRPIKTRTHKTKCPECEHEWNTTTYVEKGVDVMLVTRMLSFAFKNVYDVAILVSGDEDYVSAVEEIRNLGKRVEIASFMKSISPNLRKIADVAGFTALDEIADDIKI
jgi:uncharacterized LabA/DUF88 family protein